MERDDDDGVRESARSWIVAACCCFCNLTFYGVSRLSGIMLVATTHTFHVSRASAALPFSLGTAVRSLTGVFVGHLGHHFGVGPVVATGCIIASLGSGLCFFAQDTVWLAVCWGGIFGLGFGLCTCLLPLAINQNFSKNLGTASGISYSGSYIGSFIFPPAVVWLLNTFALQGTFLIISGGVLNVLVAALLLRDPRKSKKKTIVKSCDDVLNTDSVPEITQPYIPKTPEMWKQNLQRIYIASHGSYGYGENKYKMDSRDSIYSTNSIFIIADSCLENISGRDSNPEKLSCVDSCLHSDTDSYQTNIYPDLYRTFRCMPPYNTDYGIALSNDSISCKCYCMSNNSLTSDSDCVHSNKCSSCCLIEEKQSIKSSAKDITVVPRMCFKKPLNKSLLSGNLKAKHKLKLQKLKNVLISSFLKHKFPHFKEFDQISNVTLTSFRHISPFFCLNTCCASLPNGINPSSLPQNIYSRRSTICQINNFFNVQHYPKCRGRFYSLPALGLNEMQSVDDSAFLRKDALVFSDNYDDQRTISNCCNTLVNQQDHLHVFCSNNNKCTVLCNKIPPPEDTTNVFKKDYLSSEVLNLNPKSLLENKTEFKAQKRKISLRYQPNKGDSNSCASDTLTMFRKPMFVIIGVTMSIQTFILVSVVTTIEDYARDIGVPENKTHYALMALSVANLVGTLTLGSITDRGFISRQRFVSLCFLGMSLSLVAVSLFAVSLPTLLLLIVCYGLTESGVIITFPLLTKHFVRGQRRQAVAIASSNVLSVPTIMLVPLLIGHFRDHIGSYVGLFHLLGATSLTCSLLWLVAPSLCERRKIRKIARKMNAEKC